MPDDITCRQCGASPAERADHVSAAAVAYTCSSCVMPGGLRGVKTIKPGGRGTCLLKGQHPPDSAIARECPTLTAARQSEQRRQAARARWGRSPHPGDPEHGPHAADPPDPASCRCQRAICLTCTPSPGSPTGDIDLPPDWPQRRAGVLKRDRHRCQHCGTRQRLTVHHITPRPTGSHDPRNLVTLCSECHDALELPAQRGLTPAPAF